MRFRILLFLFFIPLLNAQSAFDINGYIKYMFSSVKYPDVNFNYNDHLLHWRINSVYYPSGHITAAAELRSRIFYGESIRHIPGYFNYVKSGHEFASMDLKLWENKNSIGYTELDRLWIDYSFSNFQATLGRQRIAWGSSWVWNPTDLFNPISVLDFDYEERPGTDALRFQYYVGPVSKFEVAYKPSKTNKYTAAALYSFNIMDYDLNIIGGIKNTRWVAGGGWTGDILDAGFRGEFLLSQGIKGPDNIIIGNSIEYNKTVFSAVLSADYTFRNSFYIHTELMYNNIGTEVNTRLAQPDAINAGLISAARLSVYQEFSYNFSPLLRGSLFAIYNPGDESVIIVPSFTYSLFTNIDLFLLAFLSDGDDFTEYGGYGTNIFARAKWSW
jgi:hypothetical protein